MHLLRRIPSKKPFTLSNNFSRLTKLGNVHPGKRVFEEVKGFEERTQRPEFISKPLQKHIKEVEAKKEMEEDYMTAFLQIQEPEVVPEIYSNELFGTTPPSHLILTKTNYKELYYRDRHRFEAEKRQRSYSFAKEFTNYTVLDKEIQQIVDVVKEEFEKARGVAPEYDPFWMDPNFDGGQIFLENEKLRDGMLQIKEMLHNTNYQNIPTILLAITLDIKYTSDSLKVFSGFSRLLESNIHLFSITELSQILFGLTFHTPKKGSLHIRQTIRRLIMEDIKSASIQEKAIALAALKGSMNYNIHREFMWELRDCSTALIEKYRSQPQLLLNYIQAFNLAKLPQIKRNSRGVEYYVRDEAAQILHPYYELFIENWEQFDDQQKERLAFIGYFMRVPGLYELYDLFGEYVLTKLGKAQNWEIAEFVNMMSSYDAYKPVGGNEFWEEVFKYLIKQKPTQFLKMDLFTIVDSFSSAGIKGVEIFNWAKPAILEYLRLDQPLNSTEMRCLVQSITLNRIEDKEIYMETFRKLSSHPHSIPRLNYFYFKALRYVSGVLYPDWDYDYFDSRCYHAEHTYNAISTITEEDRNSTAEVFDAIKAGSELDLYTLVEWENLGVVDIAFPVHRVGLLIDPYTDPDFDMRDKHPKLEVLEWALQKNGWSIFFVNLKKFKERGMPYVEELRKQLADAYATAVKNHGERDEILRKRNLMRVEDIIEDILPGEFADERSNTFISL